MTILNTNEGGRAVDTHKHEVPSAPIRRTFEPDYEIEHTKVRYTPTPLAWCLGIFSTVMFVIWVVRNA
jgi:hypothetical protein